MATRGPPSRLQNDEYRHTRTAPRDIRYTDAALHSINSDSKIDDDDDMHWDVPSSQASSSWSTGSGVSEMVRLVGDQETSVMSPSSQASNFEIITDEEVQLAPAVATLQKYKDENLASAFAMLSVEEAAETPLPSPAALAELEASVKAISENVSHMLGSMTASLHAVSGKTLVCTEAYGAAVEDIGQNVDETIQMMYRLVKHCESISHHMQFINSMAQQLKSIKATLVVFEKMVK